MDLDPIFLPVGEGFRKFCTTEGRGFELILFPADMVRSFTDHSPKLKADRPHPRHYPHTPTNYRHTDKHLRLVMALIHP